MSHLTAGDILPLATKTESTYANPTGSFAYYADIKGDGGSFTPTDNPNPYIAWRSGSRAYAGTDYVGTNNEAGYTDALEVRDLLGWDSIIQNALGGSSSAGTPRLPSRTVQFAVKVGTKWQTITYFGCKTDRLEIRADQPGGIVEFDETVLASYAAGAIANDDPTPATTSIHAVQWRGGVTINSTTVYPQNLRISINNNLGRVKGPTLGGTAGTAALVEGKFEGEISMDVWMEDLGAIWENGLAFGAGSTSKTIVLHLGSAGAVTLTVTARPMADGQLPGMVQDKQIQTLRFRIESIAVA